MESTLDINTIALFVVFILPGLISVQVYRLLMPARSLEWSNTILQGLFFTSVNFALFSPIIYLLHFNNFPLRHPVIYAFGIFTVLFVGPILLPLVFRKIVRTKRLIRNFQLPYPTAWDYFFDKREEVFLLIHLASGKMIGGYFGPDSYAGDFPNDGDLYIEAVYSVNDKGEFLERIECTKGLLLRKDQYTYIELFPVPNQSNGE